MRMHALQGRSTNIKNYYKRNNLFLIAILVAVIKRMIIVPGAISFLAILINLMLHCFILYGAEFLNI